MADIDKLYDRLFRSNTINYSELKECFAGDELQELFGALIQDKAAMERFFKHLVLEQKELEKIIPLQNILPERIYTRIRQKLFEVYFIKIQMSISESKIIVRSPGSRLNKFSEFVFSKKTYEQIYQPIVCDMQEEYYEALATGQKWKARMVCARGYFSFFSAMVAHVPLSGLQLVKKIWTIVG